MHAKAFVGRQLGIGLLSLAVPAGMTAQGGSQPAPPGAATRVSMDDAVRLAIEHNHQLRANRLNVDISKADEITAGLKPNLVVTSNNADFPMFSPSQLTWDNFANNQSFVESLSYLFERGGKREKRTLVAEDTTNVAARMVTDSERQGIF
jgi:cobalt-zinc-cadmium efflux system outer membrane protein